MGYKSEAKPFQVPQAILKVDVKSCLPPEELIKKKKKKLVGPQF